MRNNLTRRELLSALGMSPFGSVLASRPWTLETQVLPATEAIDPGHGPPSRPITCVVAGAGNRGNVYARYALEHPDEMRIVGVAEPIALRRARFAERHGVEPRYTFTTWQQIFEHKRFADAVVITTPDHLPVGRALRARALDYDILLEKPITQTWEECVSIHAAARGAGRIVAICHVLRYAPYFRELKEVIDAGALGRLISLQDMEPIQHAHMAHSFVRGNWRNEAESSPILLSKSCHDLDLLRWFVGRPSKRVSSFGALTCVYRCDNDVLDH